MPLFGKKTVLTKTDLSAKLTELGRMTDQFSLTSSPETDFIVERKIVDASEIGITGAEKLKKTYRAYLLLDEEKHEARYNEEMAETSASVDRAGFSGEKTFFRGKVIGSKQFGKEWGVKKADDPTSVSKGYDYSFDVNKLRNPIKKLVEDSGWKFKQVAFKGEATFKR